MFAVVTSNLLEILTSAKAGIQVPRSFQYIVYFFITVLKLRRLPLNKVSRM